MSRFRAVLRCLRGHIFRSRNVWSARCTEVVAIHCVIVSAQANTSTISTAHTNTSTTPGGGALVRDAVSAIAPLERQFVASGIGRSGHLSLLPASSVLNSIRWRTTWTSASTVGRRPAAQPPTRPLRGEWQGDHCGDDNSWLLGRIGSGAGLPGDGGQKIRADEAMCAIRVESKVLASWV